MGVRENQSVMGRDAGTIKTGRTPETVSFDTALHKNRGLRRALLNLTRVTGFDRWLTRFMLRVISQPPVRIYLWNGEEVTPPVKDPVAILIYNSRMALIKTIINPELYGGDLYTSGQVEFRGDMVKFMEIFYRGMDRVRKNSAIRRALQWLGNRRISNSVARARENIHHHYDLGNDFYKLWLDNEVMQYTCAYYPEPGMSLEQAQVAKLHHVCRKLHLKPGDTVVEAGCGWGGLALFMARHYGVKVRAYNISTEQVDYARRKAEQEGLAGQVEYILDDYRNISGEYDVFVSVGMLEHVGSRHYRVLGEVIDRCLKPEGRGLIHSIGRNRAGAMNAWIERRIFPGAYPPTLREMMDIFEPNGFSVLDVENIRLHYSKTLQHWSERFEQHLDRIEDMMDPQFIKAWRLYLAGSTAAFNTGQLQLFQVVFTRAHNNHLPWSRAHLYDIDARPPVSHHEHDHETA